MSAAEFYLHLGFEEDDCLRFVKRLSNKEGKVEFSLELPP